MPDPRSPFLDAQPATWIASNALAFALPDGFPVSPGHTLVVTRRLVPTWFDATPAEQAALLDLVNTVKHHLDASLSPKPDGYNVGFNAGTAAGQTVPHVHVHVIPRYSGDVPDPRGGVRHVIPAKANYLAPKTSPSPPLRLATGQAPLWNQLRWRLAQARSADILSSFVQVSGLELIAHAVFEALARGAHIRLLAGDYLFITDPDALRTLHGWSVAARQEGGQFEARLWELQKAGARSFHPKAWQIHDADGTLLVVGSSNLSRTALLNGIEWNLLSEARTFPGPDALNAAAEVAPRYRSRRQVPSGNRRRCRRHRKRVAGAWQHHRTGPQKGPSPRRGDRGAELPTHAPFAFQPSGTPSRGASLFSG
jgi:diadenosine tetraphosphate (Ap4A) HIT family hydrolase/HKD family nuclease